MSEFDDDPSDDALDLAFTELAPPADGLGRLRRTLPRRVARRAAAKRRRVAVAGSVAAVLLAALAWPAPPAHAPRVVTVVPPPGAPLTAVGPGHPAIDPLPEEPAVLRGPGSLVRVPTSRRDVVLYDLR